MYVIEFQKRGLPHAHILLICDSQSKLRTADDIDHYYIRANIPDYSNETLLYNMVIKHMVHGPHPNSPCMKDGECTKNYPNNFNENIEF